MEKITQQILCLYKNIVILLYKNFYVPPIDCIREVGET